MHRFFADSVSEKTLMIASDEAKHIKNALRMRQGDELIAFDGTGTDYQCRIADIGVSVKADIISRKPNCCEPQIHVTLYQAYPKSAKMDEIVQKAVELGAEAIVPFISERCVKKPDDVSRLRRVALAAVKQCGRSVLPSVSDILTMKNVLPLMQKHQKLIVCWEEEREHTLKQALAGQACDIGIVIGPEGGFCAHEVQSMRSAGGVAVTLGPRILRTQTAGIAVLAAVMYDKGQM